MIIVSIQKKKKKIRPKFDLLNFVAPLAPPLAPYYTLSATFEHSTDYARCDIGHLKNYVKGDFRDCGMVSQVHLANIHSLYKEIGNFPNHPLAAQQDRGVKLDNNGSWHGLGGWFLESNSFRSITIHLPAAHPKSSNNNGSTAAHKKL